jgi:cytochrome c553
MRPRAYLLVLLVLVGVEAHAGDIERGQQKASVCQTCHGPGGNGTNPQFPRLAGQWADYLVQALTEYRDGERKNAIMAPFAAQLSPQDIEDVAAYFSAQPNGLFQKPYLR